MQIISAAEDEAALDRDSLIESGRLDAEDVAGDLFGPTRGERAGHRFHDRITLFKSPRTALEDLAAAQLAAERA